MLVCSLHTGQELDIVWFFRGQRKVDLLKSKGVDHTVDLSREGLIESVKGFLKKRNLKGVDILYDPVGGKLTKESMKLLNWGAQILVIGFASGEIPTIPANIALVKVVITLNLLKVLDSVSVTLSFRKVGGKKYSPTTIFLLHFSISLYFVFEEPQSVLVNVDIVIFYVELMNSTLLWIKYFYCGFRLWIFFLTSKDVHPKWEIPGTST